MLTVVISLISGIIPSFLKRFGVSAVAGVAKAPGSAKLVIIVALVALLVGSVGGYYVTSTFYDAAHAKELSDALGRKDEQISQLISDHEKQMKIERDSATAHIARLQKIAKSKPKIVEVTKYVKSDDPVICNVPIGSVGVLDYMRTGSEQYLSPATRLSDDDSSRPSNIRRSTEYAAHGQSAIAFRECKAQLISIKEYDQKQKTLYDTDN